VDEAAANDVSHRLVRAPFSAGAPAMFDGTGIFVGALNAPVVSR
jgi:hypothetical protein